MPSKKQRIAALIADINGQEPSVAQTTEIIKIVHEGQVDKGGFAYWHHPVSVMNRLKKPTDRKKKIALMHDVIEDTVEMVDLALGRPDPITPDDLRAWGFTESVIIGVIGMTRDPNDGLTYIQKIRKMVDEGNLDVIEVKYCDNEDNRDPERIAQLPPDKQGIADRYTRSMNILRPVLRANGIM